MDAPGSCGRGPSFGGYISRDLQTMSGFARTNLASLQDFYANLDALEKRYLLHSYVSLLRNITWQDRITGKPGGEWSRLLWLNV